MRKILSFALMILALSSCSEDVRFNNQSVFQGVKDNLFWRGADATALVSGTQITVSANTLIENVSLEFPLPTTTVDPKKESTFITHTLGNSVLKAAYYTFYDEFETFQFETGFGANAGDGEIVVTEYDGVFISGTFRFNAKNVDPESTGAEVVNMQNGVFYRVAIGQAAP